MLESLPPLIGAIKALADLAKEQKNSELTQRIIELQQLVLQLQADLQSLQNTNVELRAKAEQLEKALTPNGQLTYAESVYWIEREDGKRDGPYCPNCYDAGRRFIRLNPDGTGVFTCAFHNTRFKTAEYKPGEVLRAGRSVAGSWMG